MVARPEQPAAATRTPCTAEETIIQRHLLKMERKISSKGDHLNGCRDHCNGVWGCGRESKTAWASRDLQASSRAGVSGWNTTKKNH